MCGEFLTFDILLNIKAISKLTSFKNLIKQVVFNLCQREDMAFRRHNNLNE